MKFWCEQSGDHSAKLRIIGNFKSEKDAEQAVKSINGLIEVARDAPKPSLGKTFADEVLTYIAGNSYSFSPQAVESCLYTSPVNNSGRTITVETDELEIQVLIEGIILNGGKIEIYSRHDY